MKGNCHPLWVPTGGETETGGCASLPVLKVRKFCWRELLTCPLMTFRGRGSPSATSVLLCVF